MEIKQILLIGAIIFVVLLGLCFQKSKLVLFFECVFLTALIGGYNGDIDLIFYREYYYNHIGMGDSFVEGIYLLIQNAFSLTGISFEMFHLIISAVCVATIAFVFLKMSPNPTFCMSCMFGFATLEYGIQIKAMSATAITVYAIYHLFKEQNDKLSKRRLIEYLLMIAIACGFHFVSVFFVLIPVFVFFYNKNYKKVLIIGATIGTVFLPVMYNLMIRYAPALNDYVGNYRTPKVFIGVALWQLSGLIVVELTCQFLQRAHLGNIKVVNYIRIASWVMLAVIPFYSLAVTANRIVRTWMVFYFIAASYLPQKRMSLSIRKSLLVGYEIASMVLFYIILTPDMLVIKEILTNNIFW